jgi:hypothetical protein
MRVTKKEIRDIKVVQGLLEKCPVGRLGTIGKEGCPMIKPLNYVYRDGKIYFHSAREGEKIDDIRRDGRVCFEVDSALAYVKAIDTPCKAHFHYQSVIVTGRARIVVDGRERLKALASLMEKYQPEGGYGTFPEEKLALTAVVRIDIETMTGKEDPAKNREGRTS